MSSRSLGPSNLVEPQTVTVTVPTTACSSVTASLHLSFFFLLLYYRQGDRATYFTFLMVLLQV